MSQPYTHSLLTHPSIAHGFFGRRGGVSEGIYAGLNVGVGSHDDKAHVTENRRRVADSFGQPLEKLCTVHQVHSPDVAVVTGPFTGERPQVDAMVSNTTGVVLGILTADCAPILFADAKAGVIGAAHAGWKGAHYGVIENTIAAMEQLGATRGDIAAVVGPAIGQESYEVGPEFIARFTPELQAAFFIPSSREGHAMFDLQGYVLSRLRNAGLQQVDVIAKDTCALPEDFFSYRRTTLRKEPDYGRHISAITLREPQA